MIAGPDAIHDAFGMTNDRRSSADWLAGGGTWLAAQQGCTGRVGGMGQVFDWPWPSWPRNAALSPMGPRSPSGLSDQPRCRDQTAAEWWRQRHLLS